MAILRNTDGFSPLNAGHPLADLDLTNKLKWSEWFEDFNGYDITQAIGGNPWTFTQTNCVDTILGPTGILTLTLGGADNDLGELQLAEAPFALASGKRLYMQMRFNLALASAGTIAANEIFIGLATEATGTSLMNSGGTALTADNALGVVKYDAGAALASVMRASDVESTDGSLHTPTDGAWVTIGIYYTGSQAKFYVGTAADGSDCKLISTLTGNDPTAVMTPTIFVKAGEAKANILSVDYIGIWRERG